MVMWKCHVVSYFNRLNVSCFALTRGDHLYSSTTDCRACTWTSVHRKVPYCGLNLHECLSWNYHTDVTAKKANRIRSFITTNVHSFPKKVKAACYTTLVRPVMEYATAVWAPHTAQNCNKLEQVQRRAARFACCKYERTASVTSMLNDLKWESLETWRNSQRLTMFYRMQHNMVSITPAEYLVPVQPSCNRRWGHDQMYQVPYAQKDVFNHSLFPVTVRMWNSLPV